MGGASAENGVGGASGGTVGASPIDCDNRDFTDAKKVSGPIDATPPSWSGRVHVVDDVTVGKDAVLTIEPGTVIIMDSGKSITVGASEGAPTLRAAGTADAPIRFCGAESGAGYWGGLVLGANANPASLLRNVLIADAGATASALTIDKSATLQSVQILRAKAGGISATGLEAGSFDLQIRETGESPLVLRGQSALAHLPQNTVIEAPAISDRLPTIDLSIPEITGDLTLAPFPTPYRQLKPLAVAKAPGGTANPVITFQAGVQYTIVDQASLDLSAATVQLLGSESAHVSITAGSEAPPSAEAVAGALQLGLGSTLTYTDFHLFGVPVTFSSASPVKVEQVTLTASGGAGVSFLGTGSFAAESKGLVMTSSGDSAVKHSKLALDQEGWLTSLPSDATFAGFWISSNVSQFSAPVTLRDLKAPYYFPQSVTVTVGAPLTLEPGVVFSLAPQQSLVLTKGSELKAVGTAENPIRFAPVLTTENPEYRKDCSSHWGSLLVPAEANAYLSHVILDYGGFSAEADLSRSAALRLEETSRVLFGAISHSCTWGLLYPPSDPASLYASNTFSDNVLGDLGALPPAAVEPAPAGQ